MNTWLREKLFGQDNDFFSQIADKIEKSYQEECKEEKKDKKIVDRWTSLMSGDIEE